MDIIKSIIVWTVCVTYMIVLFPLNFLVWLLTLPFDRDRVVVHCFLMYQSLILKKLIPFWQIRVEGIEKARKGVSYVIISNHQSMLDILFLNTLCYNYKWISKIENMKVPLLGWYLKMAGYITINRGNDESKAEMFEKAFGYLKKGISIMLFPEGTRSPDNEIRLFKLGAFQMAVMAEVPILPVILDGTGGILPKHGWILGNGRNISIRVLDPVFPSSFGTDKPEELAGRFYELMTSELKRMRNLN
jgi:1-acyl-sn-glycerol-3-phosphate acyltransferase